MPPRGEIPMAVKRPVVNVKKKQERKTPVKPIAPLPPGTASEATLSPAEIGASSDRQTYRRDGEERAEDSR